MRAVMAREIQGVLMARDIQGVLMAGDIQRKDAEIAKKKAFFVGSFEKNVGWKFLTARDIQRKDAEIAKRKKNW